MTTLAINRTTWSDCPCCGYKKALCLTVKDGRELFHCHAGCSQDDLWRVMRGGESPACRTQLNPHQRAVSESVAAYASKLWDKALPADRAPVLRAYLDSRRLTGTVPLSLRFLPDHPHKPSGTSWPCMVAAVTDYRGQVQAVHRTYLARDGKGKAPVEPAKMTLGAVGGYACHLAEAGQTLAIAEGIETALSVQLATGIPAWAALSAGGIRNLILPPLPLSATIMIAADADPVGLDAAHDAAQRWQLEGRTVRIAVPPAGQDFNDVIQAGGAP